MSDEEDDAFDFREKVQEADWEMLKPHHEKQSLFVLKPGFDIILIGDQMAKDDVDSIKVLLNNGDLYRPSEDDISQWTKEPNKKIANFLIISPYVIIQLIGEYH